MYLDEIVEGLQIESDKLECKSILNREIVEYVVPKEEREENKKIVIPFNSERDLERILDVLKIEVKVD